MPGRVMEGLTDQMREQGYKVGMIRPITVWPYPDKAFRELHEVNPNVKGFITVELNGEGQMVEDVALYAKKNGFGMVPCYAITQACGVPKDDMVVEEFCRILNGEKKEVF